MTTAVACLLLGLAGCASQPDVRPLATGRADLSAYELNGRDLHTLRQTAQRLCPLGGEIVREAGQSLPPEAVSGRWRTALQTATAWVMPAPKPGQMVVLCRTAEDRQRLQPPAPPAPPAPPVAKPPVRAEVTAALPVGPIDPEW